MRILLTIVSTINSQLSCSDAHFGILIISKFDLVFHEEALSRPPLESFQQDC